MSKPNITASDIEDLWVAINKRPADSKCPKVCEPAAASASSSSSAGKETKDAKSASPSPQKSLMTRSLVRQMLVKSGRHKAVAGKHGRMGGYQVQHGIVSYVVNVVPLITSGFYSNLFGAALAAGVTDFAEWSALFDIVRCKSISLRWSSVNPGSLYSGVGPAVATSGIHVPSVWCLRPDDLVAGTFAALTSSNDFTQTNTNVWTNTGLPVHSHTFHLGSSTIIAGTTTTDSTLQNWTNPALWATIVGGGVQFAVLSNTINGVGSQILGVMSVTMVCEWAFKE